MAHGFEGVRRRIGNRVRSLPLASFAFVMATGIVSVGLHLIGLSALSLALLAVAGLGYGLLVLLHLARILRHPHLVAGDLRNPGRAFGSFTFVAGTNVLGTALAMHGQILPAIVLLVVSLLVGILLGYVVPWLAVLGRGGPPLKHVDGSWFVWVVAAQSIAVLASQLAPQLPEWTQALSTIAVFGWSAGTVLYCAVAVLVLVRLTSQPVGPADMNQSYWVTMGAMAITVVAGSQIVALPADSSPMVTATQGLIAGIGVLMWSFASALIPALLAVGYWRHIVHRIPLHYSSAQWSVVFPLGMYAVAGIQLGKADELPLVLVIGQTWVWVGVLAWVLTLGTMAISVRRGGRNQLPALPSGSA